MPVVLETVKQGLAFLDNCEGRGMIGTDEELQIEYLRELDLIDDYENEEDLPVCNACSRSIPETEACNHDGTNTLCENCYSNVAPDEDDDEEPPMCVNNCGRRIEDGIWDKNDPSLICNSCYHGDTSDSDLPDDETIASAPTFEELVEQNRQELRRYIEREIKENPAKGDDDFWSGFNDKIDVQFIVNDGDQSENFNKREIWAYPIIPDESNGGIKTDLSGGVLITVL